MTHPEDSPGDPNQAPDWLVAKMDELFEQMQTPEVREATDKGFHTPPAEMARFLKNLDNNPRLEDKG